MDIFLLRFSEHSKPNIGCLFYRRSEFWYSVRLLARFVTNLIVSRNAVVRPYGNIELLHRWTLDISFRYFIALHAHVVPVIVNGINKSLHYHVLQRGRCVAGIFARETMILALSLLVERVSEKLHVIILRRVPRRRCSLHEPRKDDGVKVVSMMEGRKDGNHCSRGSVPAIKALCTKWMKRCQVTLTLSLSRISLFLFDYLDARV